MAGARRCGGSAPRPGEGKLREDEHLVVFGRGGLVGRRVGRSHDADLGRLAR